jgi:transcriptional regulator with XRE-family HTH domain
MTYHEMLKVAVKESGWSMREIARRCTKNGVNVSQPYLSKLCTGEMAPASDKVNKVLGKVLSVVSNISEDDLIIAAYLEKIPEDILEKLRESTA